MRHVDRLLIERDPVAKAKILGNICMSYNIAGGWSLIGIEYILADGTTSVLSVGNFTNFSLRQRSHCCERILHNKFARPLSLLAFVVCVVIS